jgi:peroxiredoxin
MGRRLIAGLLLLVPAMLAAAGCAGPTHPRVGLRAPQFDLPRLRETEFFGTADLQGKATVVVFWAAGCQPCAEQLQLLEKSWQRHQGEGIVVLGIQQGLLLEADDPGFARANGVTFPNVRDTAGAVAASYRCDRRARDLLSGPGTARSGGRPRRGGRSRQASGPRHLERDHGGLA